MPFKKIHKPSFSTESPEALYRDYRNRKIQGPLSHQADIVREYHRNAVDKSDVALQLPTGSGKTFVGLLIGEWRLRHFCEKVVYLCPTIQLAYQVSEQSNNEYGIKANIFVGKQTNYNQNNKAEYQNSETLAITTYSALFNTNPFFNNADIIILDDAHSAENYIAKYWSLTVDRNQDPVFFEALLSHFKSVLSYSDFARLTNQSPDITDLSWVEKIPTPRFAEMIPEITDCLDDLTKRKETLNKNDKNLKYSWSVIRDHLIACHVYISYNQIVIRPTLPPAKTHKPFSKAKQRLYMSATLGEGGELERLSGSRDIFRLSTPDGWDKQGIGRRLFLFPEISLNEEESLNLTIQMIKSTDRSLILSPDDKTAEEFKNNFSQQKLEHQIFDIREIENSQENFVSSKKAIVVASNRYDGIDFPDDKCRLLIVKNIQKATNLQEKFLVTRLAAGILLQDRIMTRIVQALGRCTRSATDYAAVLILGDELNQYLLDQSKRKLFHPELQAEIEFGIEQSQYVSESNFLDYFKIFLEHSQEWNEADSDIISKRDSSRQSKLPAIDKLRQAVPYEVAYQYAIWNKNYEKAFSECESVLNLLNGEEVRGYRAFWYYLAGSAAWLGAKNNISSMENKARDFFNRAAEAAPEVPWFLQISQQSFNDINNPEDHRRLLSVIENLETTLLNLGLAKSQNFEAEVNKILEGINSDGQENTKKFEMAHKCLGKILGYKSENHNSDGAPDPFWIANDDLCIVFEDYSGASKNTAIAVKKARQAAGHPDWIKYNSQNLNLKEEAEIISVMITPCTQISVDAIPHGTDVYYWNLQDFRKWVNSSLTVVRELRLSLSCERDPDWRKRAMQKYKKENIAPNSLVTMLKSKKLIDLDRPSPK